MRKTVLLIAALATLGAQGRSLSPAEALNRALKHSGVKMSRSATPKQLMSIGETDAPALYVFGNAGGGGYMVVAADDVAAPLIGYSDSGTFDPGNLPPNLKAWLDDCAGQITLAAASGAESYTQSSSTSDREPIGPLMTTMWNQNAPFYNDCPKVGDLPTMAGCVATAMAQVMKYHNWPDKAGANALLSYRWNGQTLSADFRNYAFDWDNMADYYGGSYSDAQASAVAKLMQACGYSVNMSYGTNESGAYSSTVGAALADYFKYDAGVHNELRELYSASRWEELIYNDLRDCGPIVYWGSTTGGTHCFVCDGYSSDGYFHFNWGWGGMSDGYFLLNMLNPKSNGIGGSAGGYNSSQGALLGVKPAGETESPRRYTFYIRRGVTSASTEGDRLSLQGTFCNYSTFAANVSFMFRIYSEDGERYLQSCKLDKPQAGYFPTNNYMSTMSGIVPSSLPDGTYRVYPAIEADGVEHTFSVPAGYADYVVYTRQNGVSTATVPEIGYLSVENLSTNGDFFIGSRFKITGTAKFSEDGDTDRNITASLLRADGSICGSGSQSTVKFSYDGTDFELISSWFTQSGLTADIEPGNYTFALRSDNKIIATCPVLVRAAVAESEYEVTEVVVDDVDAVDPTNIRVTAHIKGLSGVVDEYMCFSVTMGLTPLTQDDVRIFISEGQTATVTCTFNIPYLSYPAYVGRTCKVSCGRVSGGTFTGKPGFSYFMVGDQSGISDVEADMQDSSVEYFNLQGVRVNSDNLLPGIYIRRQGSRTSKIIVK